MSTDLPQRSLPPPSLPSTVLAEARIRTLKGDLSEETDPRLQATLCFEIASLYEGSLANITTALEHHRDAVDRAPDFRPSLIAMGRIYRARGDYRAAADTLAQLAEHEPEAEQRASLSCERGVLLYDRLDDTVGAVELWERALGDEPTCVTAALLLEHHYRQVGNQREAERVADARARAVADPSLRAALLIELAESRERDSDREQALELLETAAGLSDLPELVWQDLERVAARGGFAAERVRALEARAEIAERDQRPDVAAALWREAARVRAVHGGDSEGSLAAYERALSTNPGDVLLRTERMLVREVSGDREGAVSEAQALLDVVEDPAQIAALHARLSELARHAGDDETWISELEMAVAADPSAAAPCASLERAYVELGRLDDLHDHLVARAERLEGVARAELYMRAASVTLHTLHDPRGALKLVRRARHAEPDERVLRELYGAAVAAEDAAAIVEASTQLGARLENRELTAALTHDRYQRMRFDMEASESFDVLEAALEEEEGAGWAPDAARVQAASRGEMTLLARSHAALAAAAAQPTEQAAHLCAAARAWARAGAEQEAVDCLREALGHEPSNSYAVALLQTLLLARGETEEAVGMLQRAARQSRDARRRELSLLLAAEAAERAGDHELAARSYQEALEVEGAGIGALWALKRLGERHGQADRVLDALHGLARQEAERGGSAVARLELGEALDARGDYAGALAPLRAALSDDATGFAAALDLSLLPDASADADAREAALSRLSERSSGALSLALEKERIAQALAAGDPRGRDLLYEALKSAGRDPWLAQATLRDTPPERRALSFAFVARAVATADHATELLLHSLRISALSLGSKNADELLMRAMRIADAAPESLAAAVALDEALSAGDDPESRAHALFGRLRHADDASRLPLRAARSRALLASGRPREAADAARLVLQEAPEDPGAWEVLRVAARALGDWPGVVLAADQLARNLDGTFAAMLLEEAAVVLQDELGQDHEAEQRLRAALAHDASRELAFERLHDLLLDKNDVDGLLELVDTRLPCVTQDEARADLLFERAVILRALGRRDEVLTTLQSLSSIDSAHLGALGLEAEVHASLKQWRSAVDALRRLSGASVPPSQRRIARIGAADFLERKLDDLPGAYTELHALAEDGLSDGPTCERMAVLARRAGMHAEAVSAFEQAAAHFDGARRAELERQAATLAARSLSQPERAIEAYRRALSADPSDVESCRRLVELIEEPERLEPILDTFIDQLLGRLQVEPAETAILRTLRDAGAWSYRKEIELLALGVLRATGIATSAEREDWDELAKEARETRLKPIDDAALGKLRKSLDSGRMAELGPVVAQGLDALERPGPSTFGVEKRQRVPSNAPSPLRDELSRLGASFGFTLAELHVGGNDPRRLEPLPLKDRRLCWVVGAGISSPLGAEQRFEAGFKLAACRLGVAGLLRRPPGERRAWMRAGASLAGASGGADQETLDRAQALARRIGRAGRRQAEALLSGLDDAPARADAYLEAVEGSCQRAGLLLCDDPRAALRAVLGKDFDSESISASPVALDLLRYWVSRTMLALRRDLGMGP